MASFAERTRIAFRNYWTWPAAILSAIMLIMAFPPFSVGEIAWFALVPLLLAVRHSRQVFALGFATGAIFWISTLYWLSHVTIAGWIVLALYCALYYALFTIGFANLSRSKKESWGWNLVAIFSATLLWTGLEWIRANLFTGFSWNQIGVSQSANIVMIQIADLGGVYAVSAIIVLLNSAIALTIERYVFRKGNWGRRPHWELATALIPIALTFAYGMNSLRASASQENERCIDLGLIQPNVEQRAKWDQAYFDQIYTRLHRLTENAIPCVDLCVWPETAIPEFLRDSATANEMIRALTEEQGQILAGSMDYEIRDEETYHYFNSSFLLGREGKLISKYDKQHLVLFGEYIPFEEHLPFLKSLTPIEGSFKAGNRAAVFPVGKQQVPISPLICFEDTFPYLARKAVDAGARLLVNQTNDAWFDPSAGSLQHLAQSIFRSVETGIPMARCANTGATCWIDRHGRVRKTLRDNNGSIRCEGFLKATICVPPDDMEMTINTRYEGLFGKLCAGIAVCMLLLATRQYRKVDLLKKS